MQQQLARGLRFVILQVAVRVFIDMRVVKKDLVVLDASEGIADLAFPSAQRFDLRAAQNDAGLERLNDVVVATSLGVGQNVGHEVKIEIRTSKLEAISKTNSES